VSERPEQQYIETTRRRGGCGGTRSGWMYERVIEISSPRSVLNKADVIQFKLNWLQCPSKAYRLLSQLVRATAS